jgi:murein DD-endopeptidase MepM/ murein hydrolase activator NlpD
MHVDGFALALKLVPAILSIIVASGQATDPAPPVPPEVQVPFGCGYTFPVSQTHNGGSHLQNDTWAWDFRMPEGTPVVAARDGVVRLARGDSKQGGCDPKFAPLANYVVVDHGDGLETQYLHFSAVVVRPGQPVKAGELLGYSGETGWACGAHLHFKVARAAGSSWNNPSVSARLVGYGDPALESLVGGPACGGAKAYLASRTVETNPEAAVRAALVTASAKPPLATSPTPVQALGMGATKPVTPAASPKNP